MIITRPLRESEQDHLIGYESQTLVIKDLDDKFIKHIQPPKDGWSHVALEQLEFSGVFLSHCPNGWNAYLGNKWIGSSEC